VDAGRFTLNPNVSTGVTIMRMMANMKHARAASLAVVAFLAAGVAACDDSVTGPGEYDASDLEPGYALMSQEAGVSLQAQAEVFQPGGEVLLVLENHSAGTLGFNLCFHALERHEGGEWVETGAYSDRICTLILHMLEPGETAQQVTELPANLPAGEYRFRVALHLMDEGAFQDQVSQSFTLIP
jgi:hypothetical protein